MSSAVLCAVIFLACSFTSSAAQASCKGRCGAEYYRGYMCQCDYTCLSYEECCRDYESQCTTANSCKGRCGENFKRGRLCSCDSNCIKYNQCCSDYKSHCDAEEEINGAPSATAPVKTNSCHNVNDKKPKEPIQNEATEQPSTFSEGDDADTYSQIFPNDDISYNGGEDPEATPTPEGTSGYELSTSDLLDQMDIEPTQDPEFSTETTRPDETTQANDSPSTLYPTTESLDDPTSSPDSGTTLPPPTTAVDDISSQPAATSVPQTEYSPTANTPELEKAEVQPEDDIVPEIQTIEPTVASSDKPEVTTTTSYPPVDTSVSTGSSTTLANSQVTTIPTSSVPTTSNPKLDDAEINAQNVITGPPSSLGDLEDPSASVSPAGSGNLSELDALTTLIPTSTDTVRDDTIDDVAPEVSSADPLNVTPNPTEPTQSEATTKTQDKPESYKPLPTIPTVAEPSSKPETKPLDTSQPLNIDDPRNYQADDNNDTNLCSGRPVSGVTTLRNGTIVVFRGHYFWFLGTNRLPGPARGITQVWGVPSPIDTVFTRCNCQGKTYIFRGPQYWRFENDVLDTGYPKVIETGFDGLRGHITAALSVPQYQRRRESVYFFKRGGSVQKYSYQFGTSPTCGRKVQHATYTVHNRIVRQAVSLLGPTVNIRTSWRGFPTTVTAAVSVPSNREPEGYKYYVFSRSKSYNVRVDGERPVIAAPPANTSPQSNNIFKCPKKV